MVKKDNGLSFKPVANSTGGVLSKLWRTILDDTDLHPAIGFLVKRYVDRTAAIDTKNTKRKTKATLLSNIGATEMTWKTFNKLIFEFLNVKKLDITIKLTHSNGQERLHSLTVIKEETKEKNDVESE